MPSDRPDRQRVVELRVHGVGGANARQLLGAADDADVVQVEGDATSGFHRLRDDLDGDHIPEAYVWGGLNSKALISGFWWLLLPFTLVNIAGWMLQPAGARHARPWPLMITRGLVRLGGAGLTIIYVLYLLVLFVDVGAMRCGSDPACSEHWWLGPLRWFPDEDGVGHGVWRAAVGLSVVLVLIGVLFGASARNRRLHESVGELTTSHGTHRRGRTTHLADAGFWYQLASPGALYRLHLMAATMTLGFAAGTTLSAATAESGWPDDPALRAWLCVVAALWCGLIGALGRPDRFVWRDHRYHDLLIADAGEDRDRKRWGFRSKVVGWAVMHAGLVVVAGLIGWAWRDQSAPADAFAEHGFVELIWWAALVGVLPFIVSLLVVGIGRRWGRNVSYLAAFARQLWKGFDEVSQASTERRLLRTRFRRRPTTRRPPGSDRPSAHDMATEATRFRIYPVPVAIGLGLVLVFAGFSAVLVRTIAFLEDDETAVQLGSDKIGGNSSFFAFSVIVVVTVVATWYLRPTSRTAFRAATTRDYGPTPTESPQHQAWVGSVSRARMNALLGRRADVLLSLLLLVFASTILLLVVRGDGAESAPLFGWTWLETTGSWALLLFLFPGVFVLRAAIRARDSRQTVGKVWDVLTFWPRIYHPLAAPCYAERAVPELRDRLRTLIDEGSHVVVVAHSQGTVLCYAAVASLAGSSGGADRLGRISIVTEGSPIRQLFVPFFPEYFSGDELRATAGGCSPSGSWVNFYRDTDYIGQHLFAVPESAGTLPPHAAPADVRLLDPRRPRLALRRHGGYSDEPLIREWLARVTADASDRARRPRPEAGPTASPET